MATEIKINNLVSLFLSFETQIPTNGRPFRISSSNMNLKKQPKYINGLWQHYFTHKFRYLDEQDGFFEIEADPENNYIENSFKMI